jgi:hypothetical protein
MSALASSLIAFFGGLVAFFLGKVSERRAIHDAIRAEVHRLLIVLEEHEKWWQRRIESGDTNYPLVPFGTDVFSKQLTNIGALPAQFAYDAVSFYGYVSFLNSLQAARDRYITAGKSADFDRLYGRSLKRILRDFEKKLGNEKRSRLLSSQTSSSRGESP